MSLHDDLLDLAGRLAALEPTKPKQSSLRRAISTAYYALFHLLTTEASQRYANDYALMSCICRGFSHSDMYDVSWEFATGSWPKNFNSVKGTHSVPQPLQDVAQAFVDLQAARHDADYNLAKGFTRSDATTFVARAQQAFQNWNSVRRLDLAKIYLACFLNWKQWDKSR